MAAEQLSGRTCECGCSRSLDGLHPQTRFYPECRKRRKAEQGRRKYETTYARHHPRERDELRTPHPYSATTCRKAANDPPYVATMKCKVCFDMPHARRPDRPQDRRDGYTTSEWMVGIDDSKLGWICSGCGEPYAEEPPPERGTLIRSSAGTMEKASELWGYQPAMGGQKSAEQLKSVRAAKLVPQPLHIFTGKSWKGQNDV